MLLHLLREVLPKYGFDCCISAHSQLTTCWAFSPFSSFANDQFSDVCSLYSISIFTFILHCCIFRIHILVSLLNDYSMGDSRGLTTCTGTLCKTENKLEHVKVLRWLETNPKHVHGFCSSHSLLFPSTANQYKHLTDLLSQTGTEVHVPFIQSAEVSWSWGSYPSLQVTFKDPSSYQPFAFSVYFALGIVGGTQYA